MAEPKPVMDDAVWRFSEGNTNAPPRRGQKEITSELDPPEHRREQHQQGEDLETAKQHGETEQALGRI